MRFLIALTSLWSIHWAFSDFIPLSHFIIQTFWYCTTQEFFLSVKENALHCLSQFIISDFVEICKADRAATLSNINSIIIRILLRTWALSLYFSVVRLWSRYKWCLRVQHRKIPLTSFLASRCPATVRILYWTTAYCLQPYSSISCSISSRAIVDPVCYRHRVTSYSVWV